MRRVAYYMTGSMAVVLTLSLLTGLRGAAATADGKEEASAQIRALELAHNDAIARGDVAALGRMTADDFTYVTPRGFLIDKQHMLTGLANGAFRYEYRQLSELRIRLYGGTAVVTGRSLHTIQRNGRDSTDAFRYTRVYVQQGGQWLAVAWQVTVDDEDDARRELRRD
jgi:ketosteroid isomerase-like protein